MVNDAKMGELEEKAERAQHPAPCNNAFLTKFLTHAQTRLHSVQRHAMHSWNSPEGNKQPHHCCATRSSQQAHRLPPCCCRGSSCDAYSHSRCPGTPISMHASIRGCNCCHSRSAQITSFSKGQRRQAHFIQCSVAASLPRALQALLAGLVRCPWACLFCQSGTSVIHSSRAMHHAALCCFHARATPNSQSRTCCLKGC